MATPTIAKDPKPILERFASLTSIGAFTVASTYLVGFVIVSVHHWRYGILVTDLFRARVLSAGILFFLLSGLPILAVSRIYAVFGLRKTAGFQVYADLHRQTLLRVCLAADYYFAALGLTAAVSSPLLGSPAFARNFSLWEFAALTGLLLLEGLYIRRYINTRAIMCVVLSILLLASAVLFTWNNFDRNAFWLNCWIYLVGVSFIFLKSTVEEHDSWKSVPFENWLGFIFLLVFGFSSIYGRVSPEFGGGRPIEATAYLIKVEPLCDQKECKIQLIEETDRGIYVVVSKRPRAFFIPRDEIETIYYGQ